MSVITQKQYRLIDIFRLILENEPLELDMHTILRIIRTDLNLDKEIYPRLHQMCFTTTLSYMFVFYIQHWNGWKMYNKKQFKYEVLYEKFSNYLEFKVRYFMRVDFGIALMLHTKSIGLKSVEEGTHREASFQIEITAGPSVLNNLFLLDFQDDVWISTTHVNILQTALSIHELLHWPFSKIQLSTKYMTIIREYKPKFERFVTDQHYKLPNKNYSEFIESIEILDSNIERKVYALSPLTEYWALLANELNKSGVNITDYSTFMANIFLDIEELGFNCTIATNSSVVYNIGRKMYTRKRRDNGSCYVEIITPRVSLTLVDFTAYKENSENPFEGVHSETDDNLTAWKFSCTFCDIFSTEIQNIMLHFREAHGVEPPMNCLECLKAFNVKALASCRWGHCCEPPKRILLS